jgi:hypothetical protein
MFQFYYGKVSCNRLGAGQEDTKSTYFYWKTVGWQTLD